MQSELEDDYWKYLTELFTATYEEAFVADNMINSLINGLSVPLCANQLLQLSHATIFNFYYKISQMSATPQILSMQKNNSWFEKRQLFSISLKNDSNLINLLKLAPLFCNQSILLRHFTKCDDEYSNHTISHVLLDDSLADNELLSHGIKLEDQVNIAFEACRYLEIAIGLEMDFNISFESKAISNNPKLFKVDSGQIFFDTNNQDALSYLNKASKNLLTTYIFDFIYFNTSKLEKPLSDEQSFVLTKNIKIRPSLSIVANKLSKMSIDYKSDNKHLFPITHLDYNDKQFWRYIAYNLNLFTIFDSVDIKEDKTIYQMSKLCSSIDLDAFELAFSQNSSDDSIIIKKSNTNILICYFTHQNSAKRELDLNPFIDIKDTSLLIQKEIFNYPNYNYFEPIVLDTPTVNIPELAKNSVLIYLISHNF